MHRSHYVKIIFHTRQDKTAILGEISPIFRSFSTYFPPMVPHPPTCLRIMPISAYFSPIFCLWYPILIINSSICCPFAVFPPTCLRILLIFRLFSAYFPPIFRLKFRLFSARPVLPGCIYYTHKTLTMKQSVGACIKAKFASTLQTIITIITIINITIQTYYKFT